MRDKLNTQMKNLEGSYRRLDNSQNTGRNATSSDATRDWNWNRLHEMLEQGGFEVLDADEKLAARYSRLERRRVGLATFANRDPA